MELDQLSERLHSLVYPTFQAVVDSARRPLYHEACLRTYAAPRRDSHIQFLSTAEEVGFIDLVDHVIAEQSIALAMAANAPLGINVSVFTIERNGDSYLRLIAGARRIPGGLIVEITETVESHDFSMMLEFVRGARAVGARIALDDYGTGSFTEEDIASLKPNFVKLALPRVHQAMTSEAGRKWILDAVAKSQRIGADVIAEGIESTMHQTMMERFGVGYFQGFALSMPNHLLPRAISEPQAHYQVFSGSNVMPLYRSEAIC